MVSPLSVICFVFFLRSFLFRQAEKLFFWQLHALARAKCECGRLIRRGGRAGMYSLKGTRYQLGLGITRTVTDVRGELN